MKRSPHTRNDSGLATVEFAIVGSLLCLLIFAILSGGIFINAHMRAADEARQQARKAALECSDAEIASNVIVTKQVTPSFVWIVPFVPKPDAIPEEVSYRCGG